MKTSFVLTIWRPYQRTHVVNALTDQRLSDEILNWVGIVPPDHDYRVEYYLDPEGQYIATENKSLFGASFPVLMALQECRRAWIVTCFIPVEWIGERFSRRVLPVVLTEEPELPLPTVCAYCGIVWGGNHGPECITRGVRPLQGTEEGKP